MRTWRFPNLLTDDLLRQHFQREWGEDVERFRFLVLRRPDGRWIHRVLAWQPIERLEELSTRLR